MQLFSEQQIKIYNTLSGQKELFQPLTDGYVANGSQPWKILHTQDLEPIKPHEVDESMQNWQPYERDTASLARYWAYPGQPGYEHRIGGLEKED